MLLPAALKKSTGPIITNEDLYTVGSRNAVITWVTPQQHADTSLYTGENPKQLAKQTFAFDTKFHHVELSNLKPSTRYWYQVESNGVKGSLNSFTTLPLPEGEYLFSFAILSDPHINYGDISENRNKIYFGKLFEHANSLLIQCILDSKRRNINLALITGDLTDTASNTQYLGLRNEILPYFGDTTYFLCIGNHDKFLKQSGPGEQGFLNYVSNRGKTYTSVVYRGYHFLLIDSCRQDDNLGYIGPDQMQWIESTLKSNQGRPAFLFLHHPCNGPDLLYGLKNHKEFVNLTRGFPEIQGVFCGHIHRNKVTANKLLTGNRPYVEVPATIQFPCAYSIVQVYENGYLYNSYKVSRLDLSEMSREQSILKNGGKEVLARYSMGNTGDRNFLYSNGRIFRPRQFDLSVNAENNMAVELYEKARSLGGASLVPAYETNKSKIILGRFDSLHLALSARAKIIKLWRK